MGERETSKNCKIRLFFLFLLDLLHIFLKQQKTHIHTEISKITFFGGKISYKYNKEGIIEYGYKDNWGTKKWDSSEGKGV